MTTAFYYLVVILLLYCVYLTYRMGEMFFLINLINQKIIELEISKTNKVECGKKQNFDLEKFKERYARIMKD